jgi:hypothetical protein
MQPHIQALPPPSNERTGNAVNGQELPMDWRAEQIYSEHRASIEADRMKVQRGWLLAKQTTWFALLAGGYLLLFLLDVLYESFELIGISF